VANKGSVVNGEINLKQGSYWKVSVTAAVINVSVFDATLQTVKARA
jgi:hypothetical protein